MTEIAPPIADGSERHRLRLAAFGVSLMVLTLAVGLHASGSMASPLRRLPGDDFLPSYMAGTFVLNGRPDLLTDLPAASLFQAETRRQFGLEQHGRTGPWLNPPFYAWLFVPLATLPYTQALAVWSTLNLLLLTASVAMLYRMLPSDRRRFGDVLTIAALLLFSMPGVQAMACQQNTFLSLAILCGVVTCWRSGHLILAGCLAGLLCFKPQLAAIVWGVLVCVAGRRALAGIALSAGLLVGASVLAMPDAWADYLTKLPSLIPSLRTDRPYFWERQVTFIGFWRLLLTGRAGGPNPPAVTLAWVAGVAAVGAALATPLWRAFRGRLPATGRDRLIAVALLASPLLMPYYMDYDLLLLAIPATLLAAGRMTEQPTNDWLHRATPALWCVLFGWLYLNAAVGDATHLSLTVPLLFVLLGATVWPLWRPMRSTRAETCDAQSKLASPSPSAVRAAA
jgi:hypothetical protein